MERTKFQRLCALFLAMLMLIPGSVIVATANDGEADMSTSVSDKTIADVREQLNAISYAEYSEKYSSVNRAEAEITIEGTNYNKEATTAEVSVGTYDGVEALYTPGSGSVSWNVTIPEDAKKKNVSIIDKTIEVLGKLNTDVVKDEIGLYKFEQFLYDKQYIK